VLGVTSFVATFSLMAAPTPRWLRLIGFGPNLTLEWDPKDRGYLHRWDRTMVVEYSRTKRDHAIIIRMAVNTGGMAAKSVQVMLETITIGITSIAGPNFRHCVGLIVTT
jgi:hypothetical protein